MKTRDRAQLAVRVDLSTWQFAVGLGGVTWEVLTQKWRTRRLGSAPSVCHVSIRGKTVIVTGPTSGIGKETARQLALAGAHVILACRNTAAGEALVAQWQLEDPKVKAEVQQLDLTSFASVRSFASEWDQSKRPLHVLVNNAGIFNMGVSNRQLTSADLEEHVVVNYLSPLLLTLLLLPALKRAEGSRVVNVASKMHELGGIDVGDLSFDSNCRRYSPVAAYCQSKLAQVISTNWMQRHLSSPHGVDFVALHPGEVLTSVARTLPKWLQALQSALMPVFLFTPSQGARASLFCATNPSVHSVANKVRELGVKGGPYYDSNCAMVSVADHARNDYLSEELWKASLRLLGLEDDFSNK